MVQWLGLCAFTVESAGSIPGWGTKIQKTEWCGQKINQKTQMKQRGSPVCHMYCRKDSFLFVEDSGFFTLKFLLLIPNFRSLTWTVGRIRIHLFNRGASV